MAATGDVAHLGKKRNRPDANGGMKDQNKTPSGHRSDRVVLDVGGTHFTTSPTTLSSDSTYFRSRFSDHWNIASEDGGPIFIDQDPAPFAEILSYMRCGEVTLRPEDARLSRRVMLQAQFFGVEGLLSAVRVRAWRNAHPDFEGEDQEAAQAFDEEYGGVAAAISAGVLPSLCFGPPPDPVVVDAGGEEFRASREVLGRSPYIGRLFRDSPLSGRYSVDVRSDVFRRIMTYLQLGEVDLPDGDEKLFRCVLAAARQLELDDFIAYVKARTYRMQYPDNAWDDTIGKIGSHGLSDMDRAAAHSFDVEINGSPHHDILSVAFTLGRLPDGFFRKIT